ncbi:hypothetical protein PHYPSEUDO_003584 [Phytophthora pseudosyringae]|uniref:Uncharacterized protein n=1 Tax=Phytophthora pseudosyringae TaxID=221518 RepID=A0A8T1VQM6_9STRA|nr:hypothetical protein PHYPSEUDO_003584 [Phytophthora pseudosyringae]
MIFLTTDAVRTGARTAMKVEDAFELLQLVQSARYLAERVRLPHSTYFDADFFLSSTTDSVFRQSTRIDYTFASIVDEIQDDAVFHNESTYAQAPVWMQLAVALDRFGGNYGTGASLGRPQRLWGIGKGTVDDYTDRVVQALVDLSPKYVRWPTPTERRQTSRRMASIGFKGCVGFIDGTTIPLSRKPSVDGECFLFLQKAALQFKCSSRM